MPIVFYTPEFPTEILFRELFNSPPLGIPATTSPQKAISQLFTSQVDVKLRMRPQITDSIDLGMFPQS